MEEYSFLPEVRRSPNHLKGVLPNPSSSLHFVLHKTGQLPKPFGATLKPWSVFTSIRYSGYRTVLTLSCQSKLFRGCTLRSFGKSTQ